MSGNMLESGGKMTLHIRRNRKSVRRRGERRIPDYDKNRYATDPEYAESQEGGASGTVCE